MAEMIYGEAMKPSRWQMNRSKYIIQYTNEDDLATQCRKHMSRMSQNRV